jgi:hypothetical protein
MTFRTDRRSARRHAVQIAIVVALTAGCSATEEPRTNSSPAEPVVAAVPVLTSGDARLPLRDYLLSPKQIRQIDRARLTLIDRCMQTFGFRYQLEVPDLRDDGASLGRRYGITDPKSAAENGYQADPGSRPVQPKKPELTPEENTALFGGGQSMIKGVKVPVGGCLDEANRGLDAKAPPGADINLGQRLMLESFERSQRDSRVTKAFQTWSDCMTRAGYSYPTPLAPLGDPVLEADPEAGVKVAVADVACKQSSNLIGVWFAVESAYQKRMIAQHRTVLQATKKMIDARIQVADTIPT